MGGEKVLEVQKWYTVALSPCQVWWDLDFTRD